MGSSDKPAARLSSEQRAAILELGSRGSGGEFDARIMSDLMTMGFVEVESKTRSVGLTKAGRAAFAELISGGKKPLTS